MNKLSPISNAILYLAFCLLVACGLVLEFRLESSIETLFGLTRREWAKVHAIVALGFVATATLHIALNWAWVRGMVAKARWTTTSVAAIGLLLLVLALLTPIGYAVP
jgi:hypothetical protein